MYILLVGYPDFTLKTHFPKLLLWFSLDRHRQGHQSLARVKCLQFAEEVHKALTEAAPIAVSTDFSCSWRLITTYQAFVDFCREQQVVVERFQSPLSSWLFPFC